MEHGQHLILIIRNTEEELFIKLGKKKMALEAKLSQYLQEKHRANSTAVTSFAHNLGFNRHSSQK